jgi:hypothetical protein
MGPNAEGGGQSSIARIDIVRQGRKTIGTGSGATQQLPCFGLLQYRGLRFFPTRDGNHDFSDS